MTNNFVTTDKILIIDLEATCWEGDPPPGQHSEIIEIGCCILDTATGDITKSKGILVKPEQSEVSAFCTQLTTITPALLEKEGISFSAACDILRKEYGNGRYTWASFGFYDQKKMKSECYDKRIPYPLSRDHINVKDLFAVRQGLQRAPGMKQALKILNIKLEGTHHRGVDDAKNIAKILDWCLQ